MSLLYYVTGEKCRQKCGRVQNCTIALALHFESPKKPSLKNWPDFVLACSFLKTQKGSLGSSHLEFSVTP